MKLATKIVVLISLLPMQLCARESNTVDDLVKLIRYEESFRRAKVECLQRVAAYDVEREAAITPAVFGGIDPDDPRWQEAKALYLRMLSASCEFDERAARAAFARELSARLPEQDTADILKFYQSDVGRRFVDASLAASLSATKASAPDVNSRSAYDEYERGLEELLTRGVDDERSNEQSQ